MSDWESVFGSLTSEDVRGLYDHLGTIPWAPGSWSHNWRRVLSGVLSESDTAGGRSARILGDCCTRMQAELEISTDLPDVQFTRMEDGRVGYIIDAHEDGSLSVVPIMDCPWCGARQENAKSSDDAAESFVHAYLDGTLTDEQISAAIKARETTK